MGALNSGKMAKGLFVKSLVFANVGEKEQGSLSPVLRGVSGCITGISKVKEMPPKPHLKPLS